MLEKDMRQQIARAIERASAELGEDHFVFGPEANTLASIDLDKFRSFAERVVKLRQDMEVEYYMATKHLAGDDE